MISRDLVVESLWPIGICRRVSLWPAKPGLEETQRRPERDTQGGRAVNGLAYVPLDH